MKRYKKDPNDRLDYGFEWHKWMPDGDIIAQSEWTVSGPDNTVTLSAAFIDVPEHKTGVYVAGGTLKSRYILTNKMTTSGGRIKELSKLIVIADR